MHYTGVKVWKYIIAICSHVLRRGFLTRCAILVIHTHTYMYIYIYWAIVCWFIIYIPIYNSFQEMSRQQSTNYCCNQWMGSQGHDPFQTQRINVNSAVKVWIIFYTLRYFSCFDTIFLYFYNCKNNCKKSVRPIGTHQYSQKLPRKKSLKLNNFEILILNYVFNIRQFQFIF